MRGLRKITILLLVLLLWASMAFAVGDFNFEGKLTSFNCNGYYTEFIGQITNKSGKSYEMAVFQLDIYSDKNELLDVLTIYIHNLSHGQTKGFKIISDKKITGHIKYVISFDHGY